jgi:hypothetical protein
MVALGVTLVSILRSYVIPISVISLDPIPIAMPTIFLDFTHNSAECLSGP